MKGAASLGDAVRRRKRVEGGQAAAEYAILTFMTVSLVIVALEQVWEGVLNFYQDVASFLCLPIP